MIYSLRIWSSAINSGGWGHGCEGGANELDADEAGRKKWESHSSSSITVLSIES